MKVRLVQISDIGVVLTGYTTRKDPPKSASEWNILQAKDFDGRLVINQKIATSTKAAPNVNSQILPNDIVLTARNKFRAAVVEPRTPTLAPSSMYIIRITNNNVDPKYVAIYLNSTGGQSQMTRQVTGGSIPALLRNHVLHLTIPLPPLDQQKQITKLVHNLEQQKNTLDRKIKLIESLSENILSKIINN